MTTEQFINEVSKIKDEVYRYCYLCFGPTMVDSIFSKSVLETYRERTQLNKVKIVIFEKITMQAKDVKKAFLLLKFIGGFNWNQASQITGQKFSREDLSSTMKALFLEVSNMSSIDNRKSK